VIDLPDSSTFAAVVADRKLMLAVTIAILSGVVRGFSGFGSALIYVPLMSAAYGPRIAAATFLLVDFATGAAFALRVMRDCNWREVLPLAAAAALAAPLGTLILLFTDPTLLRWMISLLVAVMVIVLASGWRYHGTPMLPVTLAVGFLAGLLGGAVQISGPPVIVYWLGGSSEVRVIRANFVVYFALTAIVLVIAYLTHGILTAEVLALALILGPLHILSIAAGARVFHRASGQAYRRVAYVIMALAAFVSMPIFDEWLR
jgi:uncharacterized membrane protein YfcA